MSSLRDPVTAGELLTLAERDLEASSSSPRLDAEILLTFVSGLPRWKILVESSIRLPDNEVRRFQELVARRKRFEPIAYITGEREFWSLPFAVTPDVLIPRPESELVVSEAVSVVLASGANSIRMADLGTGSGCLGVSIVKELARNVVHAECFAIDLSPEALAVAKQNAARHGVSESMRFVESSWFEAPELNGMTFDLIVANPPYVGATEPVHPDTRHEPVGALYASDNGLADVKVIVEAAPRYLKTGGVLLCEVGAFKRKLMKPWLAGLSPLWTWTLLGDDSDDDRFTVVKLTLEPA